MGLKILIKDIVILGVGFPDIIQTIEDINHDKRRFNLLGFLDDNIDLPDLEFDENLVDDLGVFTPPSSPKSVLQAPKPISDIFDFFFYR